MLLINFLSEEVLVWAAGRTSSDTHATHLTLTLRTCHASERPQTSSAREKGKQECLELTPSSSLHSSQPSTSARCKRRETSWRGKDKQLMLSQAAPYNLTTTTGRVLVKTDRHQSMHCPRGLPGSPRISLGHLQGHWPKQISTPSPLSRIKWEGGRNG